MPVTLHPNLARDPDLRARVESELPARLRRVRDERRVYEEAWLRWWRIWSAERDENAAYDGRTRTYVTIGRRIIENWTQKLKSSLFPNDEWFDVISLREAFEERVPPLKALLKYFFTKQMRIRRKSAPWLRQLVTLGTSPSCTVWRQDTRIVPILQDIIDSNGKLTGKQERKLQTVLDYLGPTFRTVDLFSWYIDPVTCMDVEEASLVFEENLLPMSRLVQLAATPLNPSDLTMGYEIENVDEVLKLEKSLAEEKDKFQILKRRLAGKGFSKVMSSVTQTNPLLDVTSVYIRENYDETKPDWWRITVVGDELVVKIQKNPFWTGRPCWLAAKFVEIENEFYGRGLPETFAPMQYLLNDITDQSNDGLIWCMNPIAVVDPYKVQEPSSIRMRPGAKWLADPTGVEFMEPPKDTPAIGFQAVNQISQMMNDVSNVATMTGAPGIRRGRALQTAAGASIMQQENAVQVIDVVQNVTDQVLSPLMRQSHALALQCMTDPLILRITGADGASLVERKITAADIAGDFDFEWLGVTSSSDRDTRMAHMLQFLQIATKIPPQMIPNIDIGFDYILKSIWTDGMGMRHADRVVRDKAQMKSVDPRIENDLFLAGRGDEVKVSPADMDDEHMAAHERIVNDPGVEAYTRFQANEHIKQHIASKSAKKIMAQQQQQQQQMMQLANAAGGKTGGTNILQALLGSGGGGGGGGGANPVPNPSRLNNTNGPSDAMRTAPRGPQLSGGLPQ